MTDKEKVLAVLNDLKAQDFRNGFEDTVLQRVCRALGNQYERGTPASDLWNAECCGSGDYVAATYGEEVGALYREVKEMANGKGCFVMPSWGTYGT
jgi:hypothetical protein